MKEKTLALPRHAAKGETYLAHPEKLRFRNSSGQVVCAIIHPVGREEIEFGSIRNLASSFLLDRTREQLRNRAGRCVFAAMGYAGDDEELYMIPEVRRYFQGFTDLWPHWLFSSCFFFPSAVVIALCCIKNLRAYRTGDRVLVTYDTTAMEAFFDGCLELTSVLDAKAGIPRQESVRRLQHFRQCVGISD